MAKEKTFFRVENEESIYSIILLRSDRRAYGSHIRIPADRLVDPVLFPFLITIYEPPNA